MHKNSSEKKIIYININIIDLTKFPNKFLKIIENYETYID